MSATAAEQQSHTNPVKRVRNLLLGVLLHLRRRFKADASRREIVALAGAVAENRQTTEPRFVELSSALEALHASAAGLGRTTREQVTSIRTALSGDRISGASGLASAALDELKGSLGDAQGRCQMLQRMGDAMARLRGLGRQMQRVASVLEVSRYGFAVESARSAASLQAFELFVAELGHLAGRVRMLGDTILAEAESAQAGVTRVRHAMDRRLAEICEITRQAEPAVRQTATDVESMLDGCWVALQEIEGHTTRVAAHTGDAVYHLQFGDIVRQKLEHIEAALSECDPECSRQVLAVQAGQLDLIAAEIESSHEKIEQAFSGLTEESRLLVDAVARFGKGATERETGGDPIEKLGGALERVEELRGHGRELCDQAAEASGRAMQTANRLSPHLAEVEQVNQAMHLQALNAIIKTAPLGSAGRTLEVLSMHVQGVFEESRKVVEETIGLIGNVSETMSAAPAVPVARAAGAHAAFQEALERLAAVRDQFREAMQAAASDAGQQQSRLERARTNLSFLSELGAHISELRERVDQAGQRFWSAPEPAAAQAPGETVSARYTVASEREVHLRLTGAPGVSAVMADPPPVATAAAEDLGENVELF